MVGSDTKIKDDQRQQIIDVKKITILVVDKMIVTIVD